MSISQKHHYLPEFYLKGFTNEAGQFSIYDYEQKRIKKNLFYPSTHFFDNRNLVDVEGEITDVPEKLYSAIDERHAPVIKKMQAQRDVLNPTIEEMLSLQEFVSSIFWRIPHNDAFYLEQYKSNPLFTRNLKIFKSDTGEVDESMTEKIINSAAFIKSIKSAIPLVLMYYNNINNKDLDNWQFCYNSKGDYITTDNPILFKKEQPSDISDSEFIFPISKHHLLVRTYRKIKASVMPAPIMSVIQLLLFVQGNIYCCSSERPSLEAIIKEAPKLIFKPADLFNFLENDVGLNALHQAWLNKQQRET